MSQTSPSLSQIDHLMQDAVGRVFPAATLLIARADEILLHRAYGPQGAADDHPPVTPATRFDLASVSKLFTATAFMLLVQDGRVRVDAPIHQALPEFGATRRIAPIQDPITREILPPLAGEVGEEIDVSGVTFRHLLTHTSGLAPWRGLFLDIPQARPIPLPHRISPELRTRRVELILQRRDLAYPPGQRIAYSDLGLILLGEAVSRIAGQPLDVFIERRILQPLGLHHTGFNPLARDVPRHEIAPTEVCAWRQRRCWGEVHDENAASLAGVAGHAGLFATAQDLLDFARAFLPAADGLLRPHLVEEMTREQARWQGLRRGLGWQLPGEEGAPVGRAWPREGFGHTGFTGTSLWIDPARQLIVILLTNRVYFGRANTAIIDFRPQLHNLI
jgi:CubicO group peptidase (beta-lactamase class C family)